MLESFKYVNHVGEVLEFGKDGLFANANDLRDYSWNYDSDKNRIENFRKGVVNKTIPITIVANSEEEGTLKKNRIFEIFEKDVIAEQPGKIIIGDYYPDEKRIDGYYMQGYVYASQKSEYLTHKNLLTTSISIVCDKGDWYKVTTKEFIHEDIPDTTGRGYPYGYDYDYSMGNGYLNNIVNDHFAPCDFIMTISGYAFEPTVTIGNHIYRVWETVQANEVLTIDSKARTITLRKNNGVQVNLFSKRDRENYIFEKIPSGDLPVYWNSGFNFELTLFEERSEPKWI